MQDKNYPNVKFILKQLAAYLNVKGIRGLAAYLGADESRLYAWIRNGNITDTGIILTKCPNVNRDWLKTGEGEMLQITIVKEPCEIYNAEKKPASVHEAVEEMLAGIEMSEEEKEQVRNFAKKAESQMISTAQSMIYALGGIPRNLKP